MKLLIFTQKVDRDDPVLGFFHRWIEEFSKRCEKVIVICLEKGAYDLPENVKVLSLGKEDGKSRIKYFWNFYKYIWNERKNYDKVFVHMNQEYVLLGGFFWKFFGKPAYLWRNHASGNFLTHLAVIFSKKVFCTSKESYTARFRKTVIMPAGIDTDFFKPDSSVEKKEGSILFLGRIAPVKKVLEFVRWLKDRDFSVATIAGASLPRDKGYEEKVRAEVASVGLSGKVSFVGPVSREGALKLYREHELYVNLTPSGSFDKTILEAGACGTGVYVANRDLKDLEGKKGSELRDLVLKNHSLERLFERFGEEIK